MSASYNAWGHSTIVDPNGEIVARAGEGEEIIFAELSILPGVDKVLILGPERMQEVRRGIPVTTQRRYMPESTC